MAAAGTIVSQAGGPGGHGIDALCLGSGRFLRSVLVPFLSARCKPAIFQTRGRTFVDSFQSECSDGVVDGKGVAASLQYEVDTKQFDGSVSTDNIEVYAAGTLGTPAGKSHLMDDLLSKLDDLSVIGVGVTEAGLQSADKQCMLDLTQVLYKAYCNKLKCSSNPHGRICVVNTDNVPNNGDVIRGHVLANAEKYCSEEGGEGFVNFVEHKVAFLNSMVDRITSSRPGSSGLVPLCEPLPAKALVICDPGRDLPQWMDKGDVQSRFGVKIRHDQKELDCDIALKLRVANGTHTAVAHLMALLSMVNTEAMCDKSPASETILSYLDSLYETQILPAAMNDGILAEETNATWKDWRQRLLHPHFGLSTFFITQSGAAKCGIRLGPTIKGLVTGTVCKNAEDDTGEKPLNVSMALAVACLLRFLTPASSKTAKEPGWAERVDDAKRRGVYVGWLDRKGNTGDDGKDTVTYADGLRYNLSEGWYEFRCDCVLRAIASTTRRSDAKRLEREIFLPSALSKLYGRQPSSYEEVVRSYLLHPQGGDLESLLEGESEDEELTRARTLDMFVSSVCTLYARMVSGDSIIDLMQEMANKQHVYANGFASHCACLAGIPSSMQDGMKPLHYKPQSIPDESNVLSSQNGLREEEVHAVVFSEISGQQVIDLHTHMLPPSHGALCLWGIDELLTYHYLVAEYFMTAPASISPESFYALRKEDQADLIWDALFIQRSPVSEATRGVLTTLVALGLEDHVKSRDLAAVRKYYDAFRDGGLSGVERFVEQVYQVSGVRYAIMTNIPFDATETQHWRPKKKEYPATFKSALRVDPLLAGDKKTIEAALKASGYGTTLADARQYLHDWADTMQPEYMMASTPHDFYLAPSEGGGALAGVQKVGVNESAMKTPFAFADLSADDCKGCEETDNLPSVINEDSDFLTDVLMPVCEERNLPLALKIGAHRAVNPSLLSAGDGMVAFADTGSLARLCGRFPKVRFLATFLSRANQHEACVLASKFPNLHIYGCWWYCNNPSIIREITRMRVEMLGTAFTAQHSDARVMDQLIYKWAHSRAVIAKVLAEEYQKTISSGWTLTREEVRRDISRLFGGSYEEFMRKVLIE